MQVDAVDCVCLILLIACIKWNTSRLIREFDARKNWDGNYFPIQNLWIICSHPIKTLRTPSYYFYFSMILIFDACILITTYRSAARARTCANPCTFSTTRGRPLVVEKVKECARVLARAADQHELMRRINLAVHRQSVWCSSYPQRLPLEVLMRWSRSYRACNAIPWGYTDPPPKLPVT